MKRLTLAYLIALILFAAFLTAAINVHFGALPSLVGWLIASAVVLAGVNLFLK